VRRRPKTPVSVPIEFPHHPPPLPCSSLSCNKLGPEGGAALAERLGGNSTLQSLQYAACGSNRLPSVRLSVSAHCHAYSLTIFHPAPRSHSLGGNNIGSEGATALAAILKETQITNLGCAAARVFAFVSMPTHTFANTSSLPCTLLPIREHISFLACSPSEPSSLLPAPLPRSHPPDAALDRALLGPRPRPPVGRVDHACSRTPTSPPCDLPVAACSTTSSMARPKMP
jgi:hypothetical protein